MKVLVIGAGKMVEAILLGLEGMDFSDWGIHSKSGNSARALSSKIGAKFVENISEFKDPEWIILGLKPQQIGEVKIPNVPVLSILAAVPEKNQKEILGVTHLVRVMPNLPVRLKKGVSLISSTSAQMLNFPVDIFSRLGVARVVTEAEFEELTLLTGSGPAFFYEFTKNLAASFTSLNQQEREMLARETLLGAALTSEGKELQGLIDAVTSKGGVTIAVLESWRKRNLSTLVSEGVSDGKTRSAEIKEHLLQK